MTATAATPTGSPTAPAAAAAHEAVFQACTHQMIQTVLAASDPVAALTAMLAEFGKGLARLAPRAASADTRTAGRSAVMLSPVLQASGPAADKLFGSMVSLADQSEGFAAFLACEVELDGRWTSGGTRNCAQHLSHRHKISYRRAQGLVKLGHTLRESLPKTLEKLCTGQIPSDHALIAAEQAPTSPARKDALRQPATPAPNNNQNTADVEPPLSTDPPGTAFGLHTDDEGNLLPTTGEDELLSEAGGLTPDAFRGRVQRWKHRADPGADERSQIEAKQQEFLRIYRQDDGYKIVLFLNFEDGQIATAALHSMASELARSRSKASRAPRGATPARPTPTGRNSHRANGPSAEHDDDAAGQHGDDEAPGGDGALFALESDRGAPGHDKAGTAAGRAIAASAQDAVAANDSGNRASFAKRLAEAFVALARVNLEQVLNSTTANARPHINVVVNFPTFSALTTRAGIDLPPEIAADPATWTDNAGPVPHSILRRLACDGEISRVVFGPGNQIINAGMTIRTASPPQRRAVIARDRHCIYPQCAAPPGLCEVHHLDEWARESGPTNVRNLALVCWHHHHLIHARDQHLENTPDGWRIRRSNGAIVGSAC